MPDWSSDHANDIQKRWTETDETLVLPGACPNCLHNGAFKHVVVEATSWLPRGVTADASTEEQRYPPEWLVDCQCKHESHGEAHGCGCSGYVDTDSQPST
jgi:hypothetical protein